MVAVISGLVAIIERGKRSEPIPIPLLSVDVVASVVHAVGQVEVCQVYMNKESQPIEAIYYFPVNPEGAVTHFQAELEGRIIKGIIKEKEEAKADYDNAVKSQKTAFLGEEIKADVFKLRVGFLKPGVQVRVKIGYVTEVKNEPGSNVIRFYIPTTITPRYISPSESDDGAKELAQMSFSRSSPAPLSLLVAVSLQGGIRSIQSPTHTVKVANVSPIPQNPEWYRASVELAGNVTDMDRDFVLNIDPEDAHEPRLYSEKREDGSIAMMLHLVPSFKLDEQKCELIFVLDRSGSMEGESIKLAKKALLAFLHSMPADCYFNVVGFGSTFQFLTKVSVKYSDKTLYAALIQAQSVDADLGGTEILEPLKAIYATPRIEGYLRQIFILTDGEVSNTDGVIGIVKANAHHARVFALGIGDGASHALVEGMAKAGGGTSAFVTYNESIDAKVLNQLKNGLQPSLTDIQLEWEGMSPPIVANKPLQINKTKTLLGYNKPVEGSTQPGVVHHKQSPKLIPPVYDGSQMLVFGLFQNECPSAVTIKAESPDGPLTLKIKHSEKNDVGCTSMLHSLAAVKLVRELELEVVALAIKGRIPGDIQRGLHIAKEVEALEKEIVLISCKSGIVSKYTSFVAVDTDGKASSDSWVMETRDVPQQLGYGWHGGFRPDPLIGGMASFACLQLQALPSSSSVHLQGGGIYRARHAHISSCAADSCLDSDEFVSESLIASYSPRLSRRRCSSAAKMTSRMDSCSAGPGSLDGTPMFGGRMAGSTSAFDPRLRRDIRGSQFHSEEPNLSPLESLISLQSFDGSYSLNLELSNIIGKPLQTLKAGAAKQGMDEHVFATALAIVFFETKMTHEKAVWELVVKKARKWLSKWFQGDELNFVLRVASTFVSSRRLPMTPGDRRNSVI